MNPAEFIQGLKKVQAQFKEYQNGIFPTRAGEHALRFIDSNFAAQGWRGAAFSPWKPVKRQGLILVKTGRLRRGNSFTVTPGIAHVKNNVPYAAAQNNGFTGIVSVRAHTRRNLEGKKVATGKLSKSGIAKVQTIHTVKSEITVKAHTRKMNLPARQFMPRSLQDSPVFENIIVKEIASSWKKILTTL